ncbi:MAG: hypothetical protein J6X86_02250 [Bacteroidales bacterium]|nr:hypothetical protein [Bacteroidales bacterium]
MKRFLVFPLILLGLLVCLPKESRAQIPPAPDPACVFCGVNLRTGEAHKPGCRYYSAPKEESSFSSSYSSSYTSSTSTPNPEDINPQLPFKNGKCPECGRTVSGGGYINPDNIHSNCLLGDAIRKYWHYESIWGKAKKRKESDEAWSKMKDAEEEILKVAKKALKRGYPVTYQKPSTHLADYTPEPEHKNNISEPLMDCPTVQLLPQFSSINETNVRYNESVPIADKHEWGMIDEEATLEYFTKINNGRTVSLSDLQYDIERYNHEGGPVALGFHQANGSYVWFVFTKLPNGKYAPATGAINNQTETLINGNKVQTVNVRYEGQGKFLVREYSGGFKQIFNATTGEAITNGPDVGVLNKAVDGKQLVYTQMNNFKIIYDEMGNKIVGGNSIELYNDALVMNTLGAYALYNWRGERLNLDGVDQFVEIKAYNDNELGAFYVLKDMDHGYAVVGKGFRRMGGWYSSFSDAFNAWRK